MGKELQRQLKNLRALRKQSSNIIESAATSVNAEMVERIHVDGKDAKGGKIGSYSTNPISIGKKQQPRNTGKTFFSNGYKGFKQAIGRQSNFVTLELTGQMRQDLSVIRRGKQVGIGFKNQFNADKSGWMETKYKKKIWNLTKNEKAIFEKIIKARLKRIFK